MYLHSRKEQCHSCGQGDLVVEFERRAIGERCIILLCEQCLYEAVSLIGKEKQKNDPQAILHRQIDFLYDEIRELLAQRIEQPEKNVDLEKAISLRKQQLRDLQKQEVTVWQSCGWVLLDKTE